MFGHLYQIMWNWYMGTVRIFHVLRYLHNIMLLMMRFTCSLGLLTAPGFLGETPPRLPCFEVFVAIEGVTGSSIVGTTIVPFGWRPMFPTIQMAHALIRHCGRFGCTTHPSAFAAVVLLLGRPLYLPFTEMKMTVKGCTGTLMLVTTP